MFKFTKRIFLLQINRVDHEIEKYRYCRKTNNNNKALYCKIYARGEILPFFIVLSQSLAGSGKVVVK